MVTSWGSEIVLCLKGSRPAAGSTCLFPLVWGSSSILVVLVKGGGGQSWGHIAKHLSLSSVVWSHTTTVSCTSLWYDASAKQRDDITFMNFVMTTADKLTEREVIKLQRTFKYKLDILKRLLENRLAVNNPNFNQPNKCEVSAVCCFAVVL